MPMFHLVGRLRPGVTFAAAEAQLDGIARQIEHDSGQSEDHRARRITLAPAGKMLPLRKQDLPFFTSFLLTLAALVVLIACANVGTMMLARAARRRREIAVRLALGASRGRLLAQLLTESMLIAAAAGVVGFLLSSWVMHVVSRTQMVPLPIPVIYDFSVDGRVFAFTLAVTALTGLIFGLAPAWHATRISVTPALKEGGNVRLYRFRRLSLRNLLMVAQVAASLTLLVVVGLLSVGIQSTMGIRAGFDPSNLYLISLDPVRDGLSGEQTATFLHQLLERVRTLPSVTSAAFTDTIPVSLPGNTGVRFTVPGGGDKSRVLHWAGKRIVGSNYFETTGIPILRGRGFRPEDEFNSTSAVVVSEALVHAVWPGEDPVGRRLEITNGIVGSGGGIVPETYDFRFGNGRQTFEVVGVARDVPNGLVVQKPAPQVYFPLHLADFAQPAVTGITLMVRTTPGADPIRAVHNEIAAMDRRIIVFNASSMEEHINEFMMPLRTASWTYGLIGLFGLVLAAVGLAGVTAYSVSQRNHEIGVRVALGARANNVLSLVMKEGAMLVVIGTVLGMLGAFAAARLLAFMNASVGTVTSTSTSNAVLLLGAPLLLAGIALLACYVPARRSLSVDPLVALRQE